VRCSHGSGIRGARQDLTSCKHGVRIDFAGDGDQRQQENNAYGSHGFDYCAQMRPNRAGSAATQGTPLVRFWGRLAAWHRPALKTKLGETRYGIAAALNSVT